MKIIAKNVVQLGGHIYGRGEAGEYNGPLTERIIANFTAADGSPLVLRGAEAANLDKGADAPPPEGIEGVKGIGCPVGEPGEPGVAAEAANLDKGAEAPPPEVDIIQRTIDALKRDGITRQLDEMGVTYPPNANTKYLAKLLLVSKGELSMTED